MTIIKGYQQWLNESLSEEAIATAPAMWATEESSINNFVKAVNDGLAKTETDKNLEANSLPRLAAVKTMEDYKVAGAKYAGQVPNWSFKVGGQEIGTEKFPAAKFIDDGVSNEQAIDYWMQMWTRVFPFRNDAPVTKALGSRLSSNWNTYVSLTSKAAQEESAKWKTQRLKTTTAPKESLSEEATAAPGTGFKAADGLTYKLSFKSQADFDKYIEVGQVANAAKPAPWVKVETAQQAATDRDNTREASSQAAWMKERNNIMQSIWLAMAYLGRQPKSINNAFPKENALAFINQASPQLNQVYNKSDGPFLPYAKESLEDAKWTKTIVDPADATGKTQITYWAYFTRTFLVPNVAAKQALVVAPTTAPK